MMEIPEALVIRLLIILNERQYVHAVIGQLPSVKTRRELRVMNRFAHVGRDILIEKAEKDASHRYRDNPHKRLAG